MGQTPEIESLRRERLKNLQRLGAAYKQQYEVIPAFPYTLMLEPTNVCNLACPLCPTGAGTLKRRKGSMSFDNFKKVVDDLSGSLLQVVMWNYGEPYLNKDLGRMIDYCRSLDIHTTVSTNGFPLQRGDSALLTRIIQSAPDRLIVSIDGATPETHETYRVGSSFEKILNGLKQFLKIRNDRGLRKPVVEAQFIVMGHNQHELEAYSALMREIGVDVVTFKSVNLSMSDAPKSRAEAAEALERREANRNYLPQDRDLSRYDEHLRGKHVPLRGCARPWEMIVVNQDGEIAPCCYDIEASLHLGNAFQQDAKTIWNSEPYKDLRRKLKLGRDQIPLCSVCTDQAPTVLWRWENDQPKGGKND